MAVDRNGVFLSGRSHPRLVLIDTAIEDDHVVFTCPDEKIGPLVIDPVKLKDALPKKIRYGL